MIDNNGEPLFTSMYGAMNDTLHKEIVTYLSKRSTQQFGRALINLCEYPQCSNHKKGA